jgi:endogenous inhibitor of DNA gyrase (YacG/DUF329 family)
MSADTRACQACWTEFTATSPTKIYCSDRCRKHAWEQRKHRDAAEGRPLAPQPAATRDCPHCGEPVTIVALLTTPQAARPSTPGDSTIVPLQRRTC